MTLPELLELPPMSENRTTIAIETSSRVGSIAVGLGAGIAESVTFQADNNHGAELLPTIADLLKKHQLSPAQLCAVFVSIGPGSFTGLRIACTVARTLHASCGAKLVGVPSMPVIAHNVRHLGESVPRLAVVLDAKRGQVYAGAYEWSSDNWHELEPPQVCTVEQFVKRYQPNALTGEGIRYHLQACRQCGVNLIDEQLWQPLATAVYALGQSADEAGQFTKVDQLNPIYLRLPEAEEVWRKKHGQRNGD